MAAIATIVFAAAAGFGAVVVATILVIIGVRHEERRRSLLHDAPPTASALIARHLLGTIGRTSAGSSPPCPPEPPYHGRHRLSERKGSRLAELPAPEVASPPAAA